MSSPKTLVSHFSVGRLKYRDDLANDFPNVNTRFDCVRARNVLESQFLFVAKNG